MTRRFTWIGISAGALLVALCSAAGVASAQNTSANGAPFRGGRGGGPPALMSFLGPIGMLGNQLSLTDSQREQIKSIAQNHADEWKALLTREQQARQAEQAAIAAAQFDEVTIRQKSADLAAVNADIAVARARAHGELLQVLTPDQQAKLNDIAAKGPRGNRGRGPRPQ
jgi:Spy/CpxP family protein refolding chaperone